MSEESPIWFAPESILFPLCLESSFSFMILSPLRAKNVGRCNDPAFHQNLYTEVYRCSPRLFWFVLLSVLRNSVSDVKTSNVLLWFCLYCSNIYFLVMRTVWHVSKCSSNLCKIDILQFLLTHVQGMYHLATHALFPLCKIILTALWNCTYRFEFGFGRRDAVIQPLVLKMRNPQLSMLRGGNKWMLYFAVLRIKRLWWPGNII